VAPQTYVGSTLGTWLLQRRIAALVQVYDLVAPLDERGQLYLERLRT
jgi:hypothetical protein